MSKKLEEMIESIFGPGYTHTATELAQQRDAVARASAHHNALLALQDAKAQAALASYPKTQISGANYPSGMGATVTGVSSNPYVDPLVFATQTALKQPADKRWRRFQHALFKLEDVENIYTEGSGSVQLRLRSGLNHCFTLPFDCDDPLQWFAEHVLNMEFPNNRPTP